MVDYKEAMLKLSLFLILCEEILDFTDSSNMSLCAALTVCGSQGIWRPLRCPDTIDHQFLLNKNSVHYVCVS